jgi:hypothetical protein
LGTLRLVAANEVGVEVGDAKVVDRFPIASIADPLQDNEAAIFTQKFIADLQVMTGLPTASFVIERMLGRGANHLAAQPQLPNQSFPNKHFLHTLSYHQTQWVMLIAAQHQIADSKLFDELASRRRPQRCASREADFQADSRPTPSPIRTDAQHRAANPEHAWGCWLNEWGTATNVPTATRSFGFISGS